MGERRAEGSKRMYRDARMTYLWPEAGGWALGPSEKWLWQRLPQSVMVCELSRCSATVRRCLPLTSISPSDMTSPSLLSTRTWRMLRRLDRVAHFVSGRSYNLSYTIIFLAGPSPVLAARVPVHKVGAFYYLA